MARRRISDEEHKLFQESLHDAKPLRSRARVTSPPKASAGPRQPPPKAPVYLERPAEPIGGHRAADLRRGRTEPEGRIDLHGMTHDGAYRALIGFLTRAQSEDKRVVLVVTGKGGVLREALPLWLGQGDLVPLVSGVAEAHIKHGGSGAFYVSLRRLRRPRDLE
jgi:DNA-nicking Smr family endonuclease